MIRTLTAASLVLAALFVSAPARADQDQDFTFFNILRHYDTELPVGRSPNEIIDRAELECMKISIPGNGWRATVRNYQIFEDYSYRDAVVYAFATLSVYCPEYGSPTPGDVAAVVGRRPA